MAFRSGAITDANPAAALVAQIEAEFDAHGNWDLADTVTIGTNTHRVWKNRGTGTGANAFGQDFHVDLQYDPAGGTTLRIRCFEAYDAVNDKAIRPCVGATTSLAINANGSHGDETLGFTLEPTTAVVYADVLTVTTGFDFYIQVSANRLCVASKYSTTDTACYAGLFESLMAADPFPLCIGGTSGNENASTVDFGVSRHPVKTTTETNNFLFHMSPFSPISGDAQTNDLFHNAAVASRPFLRHLSNVPAQYGYARGLLHGAILLPDGGTASRNGDTLTVASATYTKMRVGTYGYASGLWVENAAA
jgi:hypothetical protein